MSDKRVVPGYKITPCSVIGEKIEVYSRNVMMPCQKVKLTDECEEISYIFTFYAKDNSKATILEKTDKDCLINKYTLKNQNDSISGTKIHIKTLDRIKKDNISVKNLTGRHKSQHFVTKDFTCVELIKEETNIISSQDYEQLIEKKLESEDSYSDIILDK